MKKWTHLIHTQIHTWDLVPSPDEQKPIGSKGVFNKVINLDGSVEKKKAKFAARAYSRVEGIDFGGNIYPIAKLTFVKFILSVAIVLDLKIKHDTKGSNRLK